MIDLAGQTAIPGLIEGHGHYTSFGGSLLILDFRHAKSFAEIVAMVADAAKRTPVQILGRRSGVVIVAGEIETGATITITMNICFLTDTFFPRVGGAEMVLDNLATRMIERGETPAVS